MDENKTTITSYEHKAAEYIQSRSIDDQERFSAWIVTALSMYQQPIAIFEVGSGPGYTADYLESLDYIVTRSDIVDEFIAFNESRHKIIIKHNVITDPVPGTYDVVLAVNVMQHLNTNDMKQALTHIWDGLKSNGQFMFTITIGDTNEWHDDKGGARYFAGWKQEEITELLKRVGFTVEYYAKTGYKNWVNIIARK